MDNSTVSPSPNAPNGDRDASGRFKKGNSGGPGNPYARRTSELRTLLLDTVSPDDLRAIVTKLVEQARNGDVVAIREVLNRVVGKPHGALEPEKLEYVETRLELAQQRIDITEEKLWQDQLG